MTAATAEAAAEGPEALFARAEDLAKKGDVKEARAAFSEYAGRFPKNPRAAEALFLAASLAAEQEDYQAAAELFSRVADKYAGSPFGPDACVLALVNWQKAGRPERTLALSEKYFKRDLPPEHQVKVLLLGSEAAEAEGKTATSARLAMAATDLAGPAQKKEAFSRLVSAGLSLPSHQALALIPDRATCGSGGTFLLAMAEKHLENKNQEQARDYLTSLMSRCPDAPFQPRVRALWEELTRMDSFNRHLLGGLLPFSGPYTRYGEAVRRGVELALSLYNAGGGEPAEIIFRDSGGSDQATQDAFKDLVNMNVAAVIGPIAASGAIKETANEENVPALVFSQKQGLTEPGGYVFRNYLTPELQARALVSYCIRDRGLSRFAILYPREYYGETFLNAFWDQVLAQGGSVTAVESYDPSLTDFGDAIKGLTGSWLLPDEEEEAIEEGEDAEADGEDAEAVSEAEAPAEGEHAEGEAAAGEEEAKPEYWGAGVVDFDAVFIPDSPRMAGLILPQLLYYDVEGTLALGTNLWHSQNLFTVAGKYAKGSVFPDIFHVKSENSYVLSFVTAFREQYGTEPGFLEALGFDSAMTLLTAGDRFQVKSSRSLRQALVDGGPFAGVTGLTYFTDTGESVKDLYLLKADNKTFSPVYEPQTQP